MKRRSASRREMRIEAAARQSDVSAVSETVQRQHRERSADQGQKSRNRPTRVRPADPRQRGPEHTVLEGWSLQQMVLGKLNSYLWKNEIRSSVNTVHKNKLKMD